MNAWHVQTHETGSPSWKGSAVKGCYHEGVVGSTLVQQWGSKRSKVGQCKNTEILMIKGASDVKYIIVHNIFRVEYYTH